MARKKKESTENRGGMDRLSLALTLVAVSAFAIFAGYLVGQYAIQRVTSPLGTPPQLDQARLESESAQFQEPPPAAMAAPVAQPSSQSASASATSPSAATLPPASSPSPAAGSSVFRVQIGGFSTRDQANEVAEALKRASPPVPDAWVLFDDRSGEYRVQAGAFSGEARAREFVQQLSALGHEAFIAP